MAIDIKYSFGDDLVISNNITVSGNRLLMNRVEMFVRSGLVSITGSNIDIYDITVQLLKYFDELLVILNIGEADNDYERLERLTINGVSLSNGVVSVSVGVHPSAIENGFNENLVISGDGQ